MQFRPGLMLAAVAGRDVSGLAYAEVITLLKQVGRPVVLSFTHDSAPPIAAQIGSEPELGQIAPDDFANGAPNDLAGYYATSDYCDDSTSDDEIQAGPCHWHKRCREPCMNTFPMGMFTEAGYVFRGGNIYKTSDFASYWGLESGRWPLDAVPAHEIKGGQISSAPIVLPYPGHLGTFSQIHSM
jgi:hypothetical protein